MNQESYELNILEQAFNNLSYFKENFMSLQKEFEGKFVAIKDRKVIDSAPTKEVLFNKLEKKRINLSEILIEYVQPKNLLIVL